MKFNFKIQQYQTDAVESIVKVFSGQPYQEPGHYRRDLGLVKGAEVYSQISMFLDDGEQQTMQFTDELDETGFMNEQVLLSPEILLKNIRQVQQDNNVKLSDRIEDALGRCSLDVEMETGTGKTYVYIKTMHELYKRYGWSKFIIVVPSIAIREGVKKSFEITQEHFMEQYGRKIRFFVYNSSNLNQLDSFSSNAGINAMIINMQAFNTSMKEGGRSKESRIIYDKRDEFGSRRPIDVIKANNPIIILDEPQKMGGDATQKALKNFNPLFCLNFSATHKQHHNLIYALDAVDAYNQRLVKKIEVKGFQVKNFRGTDKYLYLQDIIISPKHPPKARIELEILYNKSINRETRIVGVDDNLYEISNMEQYKGFRVSEVDPISATVSFVNGESIHKGDVVGDISEKDMRRIQIRETIKSHLEKEEELFSKGIKTLSLFFIDQVDKYRKYDADDGHEILGEYGKIFEQEYTEIVNEYLTIFDTPYQKYLKSIEASRTHAGYFSIDKKGHAIDSELKKGADYSDDISAYDLILKNKERLLSFEEPVRFIFSHSALREGWDNPNVFQICTLKRSDSSVMKRQEVGRGLRLCVNQEGFRMDEQSVGKSLVHKINKLTVIASESYKDFVTDLQRDIKTDLYERPVKATIAYFTGKTVEDTEGQKVLVSDKQATAIYQYLVKNGYVDDDDRITEAYRVDLENNNLAAMGDRIAAYADGIHKLIQSIFDEKIFSEMITNGHETKVPSNDLNDNFFKKEFQTLWGYINHKYAYTVSFDSQELIRKAIAAIDSELYVSMLQYTVSSSEQKDDLTADEIKGGASFKGVKSNTQVLRHFETSQIKYDLIGKVAQGTVLTRRTVAAILQGISPAKFAMYKHNPEEFISKVIKLIKEQKATEIVEHISYNQTDSTYDSTIFTADKHATLDKAIPAQKHIQDYVFTDGIAEVSNEKKFADELEGAKEVCVYAKLPKGFSIPTPVGNYSPDWAIAFNEGTVKHIFFIAETKGTMESLQLRPIEKAKISCARKLFNEISTDNVVYHDVDSYQSLLNIMPSIEKKTVEGA